MGFFIQDPLSPGSPSLSWRPVVVCRDSARWVGLTLPSRPLGISIWEGLVLGALYMWGHTHLHAKPTQTWL